MVIGGNWWFLVVLFWSLVVIGGSLWFFVVLGGSWWFLVVIGGSW